MENYENIYNINILNKRYFCYYHNCYNIDSLHINRFTNTYTIETIMDLMDCNAHQIYTSPYGKGYITHLIFETKLKNNKVSVKCKGFAVGYVVVDYKNGKAVTIHYDIKTIYMREPKTIKHLKEFEKISLDKDLHILIFKNLANSLRD